MRKVRLVLLMFAAAALGGGVVASAQTTVVEHFNDYGDERRDLLGLGDASGGWGGDWHTNPRPDYLPGEQLTFNSAYYNNLANQQGANDGLATYFVDGTGSLSGQYARRDLAEPMTGTVWISALAHTDGPSGAGTFAPDAIFWLNASTNNQNYFGLRSVTTSTDPLAYTLSSSVRYANTTPTPYRGEFAEGVAHLMLAKIDLNVNVEGHDNLSFWVDPDISGGEAGLGTPLWEFSGSDAYPSLSSIGISFTGVNSHMDSIRVSNAADGLRQVTLLGAPDPLPGDANRDGQVTIADLGILAANWQSTEAYWELGDFSGDDGVTIADLGILAANWQAGTGGTSFGEAMGMFDVFDGVVVPEPGAVSVLGLLGVMALRRRR